MAVFHFVSHVGLRHVGLLGLLACALVTAPVRAAPVADVGALKLQSDPTIKLHFDGPIGRRVDANVQGWLLTCPQANPGLLEMFRVRDRQPAPQLVPWAGEFVGKYLISAIQALRMVDDPALDRQVSSVVEEVYKAQADDGYLGPFPRDQRLLGQWDLWGHYHVMQALLMWHQRSGDERALQGCRRAADLMTHIYLDGKRRVFDAGSHEMNMAVIHGLGQLYRRTGEARYRQLMHEIEQDWQRAGDYFRVGLAADEFFRTPRPRWESLHDLEGLVDLYRITGDDRYRQAFLNHWNSIRRWDRRNSGAFSSGEQATGNPFEPTPIETCCTIAWMAISLDALQLSADPRVADEIELSTFNAAAGAQHPSGRWWTYSTPMDGIREASAHAIVFQARAGTSELNCCSVNGPRGLGMLSEWAFLRADDGLAINYYGPCEASVSVNDKLRLTLVEESQYPLDGRVTIRLKKVEANGTPGEFTLRLRIPAWSAVSKVSVNGQAQGRVRAGEYLAIRRAWQSGDAIELSLDLALRYEAGDLDAAGRISLYRGPLLLAFDQQDNDFDEAALAALDVQQLNRAVVHADEASASPPADQPSIASPGTIGRPWLLVELPATGGQTLRLRDFASAGAAGTRYRSWLPAENAAPPAPVVWQPADGATVSPGRILFSWRRPAASESARRKHRLTIAADANFAQPIITFGEATGDRLLLPADEAARLKPGETYFWKLTAISPHGSTDSIGPAKRFHIDAALPPLADTALAPYGENGDGLVTEASLAGKVEPSYGKLVEARAWQPAARAPDQPQGAIALDGRQGLLRYALKRFPADDYTLAIECRFDEAALASGRAEHLQQVASAWSGPSDDPLRLCLERGKLFARMEAGNGFSTPGVTVEPNRWYHLAVVKEGPRLRLFVDGQQRADTYVVATVASHAQDIGLGGNPHFTGDEYLPARLANFRLWARALTAEEVRQQAAKVQSAR